MLKATYSAQFRKDYKLCVRRGYKMEKLDAVMLDLERGVNLDPIYREHQLYGSYKGFLECHIEPDWLLVYFIDLSAGDIYFARTGTHADLF